MTPLPHVAAERADLVASLVRRLDACRPSDVADLALEEVRRALDARDVVLYVVNLEESELQGVVSRHSRRHPVQPVEDSPVGDCYVRAETGVRASADGDGVTILAPVSHGLHRLGVLELTVTPVAGDLQERVDSATEVGRVIAAGLLTKSRFGDSLQQARRSQEMALGAELLDALLPPAVHATPELVVAALLEPGYSTGGDAYDYAVNGATAHLAILDAMGHGFGAALTSTVVITAYRNARRAGLHLVETYEAMEAALVDVAPDARFVTAVLAELDTGTGRLTWLSAGHPAPLLVRGDTVGDVLPVDPVPPPGTDLGLGAPSVSEDYLEPGDVLVFYTDGLTEARDLDSALLGVDGLVDLVQRSTADGQSLPELVRALRGQLAARPDAWLSDDATALCVEWRGPGPDLR